MISDTYYTDRTWESAIMEREEEAGIIIFYNGEKK